MEPIFSHGVLDSEQARFKGIDRDFRRIMETIHSENRVCTLCKIPRLAIMLKSMIDKLTICQSSLNEFLEVGTDVSENSDHSIRIHIASDL